MSTKNILFALLVIAVLVIACVTKQQEAPAPAIEESPPAFEIEEDEDEAFQSLPEAGEEKEESETSESATEPQPEPEVSPDSQDDFHDEINSHDEGLCGCWMTPEEDAAL